MSNTVNNYTETDLGNISLNPRGEYDNSAAYEYLDTVSYRGGSYFCLAELETTITGIAPDAGHNSDHWQMIAAPGDMTPEYTTAYNDVINKAVQVETSRAAVELAQQEIEAVQTDVQQLHSDTVRAAQEAENSKNSAANSAQSAEQSRKTVSESEQNINGQIAGFDSRVSEAVEQSKEEINTTKQQAINTITNQQTTSVNTVKTEGEKIISRVGNDAKTVADDRATVEEATQTVLNNAQEVARNAQTVASNTENAAASAENAKTSADNAAQSAKSVEDASKQIEQNKKDVDSLKEDLTSKADKTALVKTDRKLDALWKLNQGISYEFQTDEAKSYQKTVPSGAKMANVKSIGGKTIAWNQLITNTRKISFSVKEEQNEGWLKTTNTMCHSEALLIKNHTYIGLLQTDCQNITVMNAAYGEVATGIFTCNNAQRYNKDYDLYVVSSGVNVGEYYFSYMLFDLTQMFGSGNEPSTPEEFEAMFPADYYPYNAGELMSAPVNEVVEQGRNLFDCYGFSSISISNIADKRVVTNDYGTTISTIDPTNRLIVTQNKANGSSPADFRNGYFNIGIRGLKYNTEYTLAFDFTPTKMLIANPLLAMFVNGKPDGDKVAEFSLNVKKHVTTKFTYKANNDMQAIELRNSGMSGIIENFQIEEGTTVATYSPYHKTSYPIPQAILNLPGYGWSAGNVGNEVNWENKQYIQRVDKVDLGTLNWEKSGDTQHDDNLTYKSGSLNTVIRRYSTYSGNSICEKFNIVKTNDINRNEYEYSIGNSEMAYPLQFTVKSTFCTDENDFKNKINGIMLYYELAEPIVSDISDIIGTTFQEPLEVEIGGTLTFKNSHGDDYRIPVQSTEEYLVSLVEVAK